MTRSVPDPIPPGSTIGILGGGQLGRMTAMAAARVGYRCHIFAPEGEAPAADVAAQHTRANYDDPQALEAFAESVSVVTLEFENIPTSSLEVLAAKVPVRPSTEILAVTQDRLSEKSHVADQNLAVAAFQDIEGIGDLRAALMSFQGRGVLKTRRFGYDGKGQWLLSPVSDLAATMAELGKRPAILEQQIDFEREISVIVARSPGGVVATYPPVENQHRNHILNRTLAPAAISDELAGNARDAAEIIARSLDLEGILAVEMFVTRDERIVINELAPRPHNSGHWTIEGCSISQFEAHVRAVCNLPLIKPEMLYDRVTMDNLLGDEVHGWSEILREPRAFLHLYGKRDVREGRKLGHVTRVGAAAL